ncbi:hypothetical protein K435DRAFT_880797 [Dendrothele bispora CBS 962.96]|uniref:Uncharacterized protein n=1 Tax=Dendrothele bispora (strain CBS 962.96) TaxID=1314807 RepID=A0A4S8KJ40_DENBC|nr:hypothetical protein K435DRAFT_880797 [Dendrothele bispora CBS 962.96]
MEPHSPSSISNQPRVSLTVLISSSIIAAPHSSLPAPSFTTLVSPLKYRPFFAAPTPFSSPPSPSCALLPPSLSPTAATPIRSRHHNQSARDGALVGLPRPPSPTLTTERSMTGQRHLSL